MTKKKGKRKRREMAPRKPMEIPVIGSSFVSAGDRTEWTRVRISVDLYFFLFFSYSWAKPSQTAFKTHSNRTFLNFKIFSNSKKQQTKEHFEQRERVRRQQMDCYITEESDDELEVKDLPHKWGYSSHTSNTSSFLTQVIN